MRHAKKRFQLNRFTSWRKATLISIAKSLLIHQSIRTTKVKAKAAQPLVEHLVTLAKQNTLFAKRQAYRILSEHKLVAQLFSDIAVRFAKRSGGYTRILNLGPRRGDNAQMAILELTELKQVERKKYPKKEKEVRPVEGTAAEVNAAGEHPLTEQKPKAKQEVLEKSKPPITKKPTKKFLGGLKNIFKKERDSL